MAKKQMIWKTKEMNKDLSVSAFNPEFAFENRNLRLSANEGNTLMSWVNEKGTEEISLQKEDVPSSALTIKGTPVGTAVLNDFLILFTHKDGDNTTEPVVQPVDYIYRFYFSGAKAIYVMSFP